MIFDIEAEIARVTEKYCNERGLPYVQVEPLSRSSELYKSLMTVNQAAKPTHGKCSECHYDTETSDENNEDWLCDSCRDELVRQQTLDHFLDDPRHGQAEGINRGRKND